MKGTHEDDILVLSSLLLTFCPALDMAGYQERWGIYFAECTLGAITNKGTSPNFSPRTVFGPSPVGIESDSFLT